MNEQAIMYGDWKIHIFVQRTCAACLIRSGESFNDGPTVFPDAKEVHVWNIDLVGPSDCESHVDDNC